MGTWLCSDFSCSRCLAAAVDSCTFVGLRCVVLDVVVSGCGGHWWWIGFEMEGEIVVGDGEGGSGIFEGDLVGDELGSTVFVERAVSGNGRDCFWGDGERDMLSVGLMLAFSVLGCGADRVVGNCTVLLCQV